MIYVFFNKVVKYPNLAPEVNKGALAELESVSSSTKFQRDLRRYYYHYFLFLILFNLFLLQSIDSEWKWL